MLTILSAASVLAAAALNVGSIPVGSVDLTRYQGVWYEIASKPQPFQAGCICTQAEYSLDATATADPVVEVVNTCWRDGVRSQVSGTARVVDHASNASLFVQFPDSPGGSYNIIALDPDYRFAVVRGDSDASLWILAREREPAPELVGEAVAAAAQAAASLTGLTFTEQQSCPVVTRMKGQ